MNTSPRDRLSLLLPLVVGLILSTSLPVPANRIVYVQEWEHTNFANNGLTLRTGGTVEVAPLTGVGIERFLLSRMSVTNYKNGIGQWSLLADYPDPPSFADDRSMFAQFNDGVFQFLGNVSTGGRAGPCS